MLPCYIIQSLNKNAIDEIVLKISFQTNCINGLNIDLLSPVRIIQFINVRQNLGYNVCANIYFTNVKNSNTRFSFCFQTISNKVA